MSFVHLHVRSGYSLLNGTAKIPDLVKRASELGFQALALTDENVLYGAIPFYEACKAYGIKPIIGMIATIALEGCEPHPLVLLAQNNEGYRHLLKISSAIQTKAKEGIPEKWLKHYNEGLIALTPGRSGQIETLLRRGQRTEAKAALFAYKQLFGGRLYIAMQRHGRTEPWQQELIALSEETDTPLVATNDVHYLDKEDAFLHDCLAAIRQGTKLHDEGRIKLPSDEYYLKSTDEMKTLFADLPAALENAEIIASQCCVDLEFNDWKLPKYPVPDGQNAHDYLRQLCLKGLHERIASPSPAYLERLRYELEIIQNMNFSDYFLIVADFIEFARKKGMMTGPGRGSAAGSLVAYALYITNVDPVRYGLLFERFLNPERVSMPDIDIDFPDERREEVIQYVAHKYGLQHVAHIVTFGTFGARAAIRDVGKVMGMGAEETEAMLKHIPNKMGVTLQEAYSQSPRFREAVDASRQSRQVFAAASRLEGLPRHTSIHAAGIVISEQPLSDIVPLQQGHGDVYVTQYAMDALEKLGLLKMDFLGLRTLTFMANVCKLIEQKTGKTIDVQHIPLDDAKTYSLLSRGNTAGIFQFESEGMKNVLKQLRPSQFEDLVAVNALYRPGPMDFIPTYIRRKHSEEEVAYLHRDLEPILRPTYGVLIYQEQIMEIAAKMAGFSLGQADLLRRAVGKKKKEILDEERARFVNGCVAKGYDAALAHKLYDAIVRFANYGFNRSHAVAYSMIAFQLAYLKAHYPLYFYAALLTSVIGDEEKIADCVQEMRQRHIRLLPPSVNRSYYSFSIEHDAIRYSLAAVKHVGAQTAKAIVEERKKRPFSDLFDFCLRLSKKGVNRKALESLILAGACDEWGVDRAALRASIDAALEHADLMGPYAAEDGLLDMLSFKPKYAEAAPFSLIETLAYEKELLGVYLSTHPTSAYAGRFAAAGAVRIADARKVKDGTHVRIGVYVAEERKTRTKKGEEMAFFSVSDESGDMEAVAFPDVYRRYHALLQPGTIALFEGKAETHRASRLQLIIKKVLPLAELQERALYVKISPDHIEEGKLEALKNVLRSCRGSVPVVLYYERERKTIKLSEEYYVDASSECLQQLRNLLGDSHVVLQ